MGDINGAFMRNSAAAKTKAQNRNNNVQQLKIIGQSHPTGLTNDLLKLFEPRAPLEFKPPPEKPKRPPLTGLAQYVSNFAEPGDPQYAAPVEKEETPAQRRARIHQLKLEKGAEKAAEELEKYDPNSDPNISGDPYKTLFVARLNYETTESRLKREFDTYGPIKRVRVVTDKDSNKPRGYGFIEYMHTRDMKAAYKQADGKKIEGRRVLVDVERGRTVPNWRPRRLGGGLGTTRIGSEDVNQRNPGREQVQPGGQPRSEEPRVREERHVDLDREKSRERGKVKEREWEKSRERSHDKPRERDHREDRHHRNRDRNQDRQRGDKEKERDRGRDQGRDRGRDYERDQDRDCDRKRKRGDRDRTRERERDYEVGVPHYDRSRSHDKEPEYDRVELKHDRDRRGKRDYDHTGNPELYEHHRGQYDDHLDTEHDHDRYKQYPGPDRDDRYDDRMEVDDDRYEKAPVESREREKRSSRSISREY